MLRGRRRGSDSLPSQFDVCDLLSPENALFLPPGPWGVFAVASELGPSGSCCVGNWVPVEAWGGDQWEWELLGSTWTVVTHTCFSGTGLRSCISAEGRDRSHTGLPPWIWAAVGLSKSKSHLPAQYGSVG